MDITTDTCRAAYDMLRTTKPFTSWRLPKSDQIIFSLTSARRLYGAHQRRDDKHVVWINPALHRTLDDVLKTMAHEMIHVKQEVHGLMPKNADPHDKRFGRAAKKVCAVHGWDVQF